MIKFINWANLSIVHKISLYLILVCLCFFRNLNAQSVFTDSEFRFSEIQDMISINDGEYVIVSKSAFDNASKVEYFKDDVLLKKYYIDFHFFNCDLRKTDEGIVLGITGIDDCDVIMSNYSEILMDTFPEENGFWPYLEHSEFIFKKAKKMSNGDLAMIEGYYPSIESMGLRITREDSTIFYLELVESNLDFIKEINDRLFFYGQDLLLIYNPLTEKLDTIIQYGQANITDVEIGADPGLYYVLTSNAVIQTDFLGNNLSYDLDSSLYTFTDIIFTDHLYILGHSNENNNVLLSLKEGNLVEISNVSYSNHVTMQEMYKMTEDEIWIVGNIGGGMYGRGSYVISKNDLNASSGPNFSVELISALGNGESGLDFEIGIKNNSSDTLKNVRIYSSVIDGVWCSTAHVDETVELLLPGEEKLITSSVSLYFNTSFEGQVCVYGVNSDNSLDSDLEDNFSCLNVTKTKDFVKKNDKLELFPNPSASYLTINSEYKGSSFMIFDYQGQIIQSGKTKEILEIDHLNSGLYIMEIRFRNQVLLGKFIKI